ncbi:DnaB-like helicase N-terminal domain-containing protein [Actinacidiphila rubida]|nr:DnaB-like helicase N-terminal domain-containing protein [Actinacidiphila rubida]
MNQRTAPGPDTPSRPPAEAPAADEPPNDLVAEQAVLGACMFHHRAVDEVRALLVPEDFYRPAHETIYRAILALRADDAPTDPIVLTDYLLGRGDLSRVGGAPYLHVLASAPPTVANAEHYAEIVRRKADLRRLRENGIRAVQWATEPGADPDAIRSAAEAELRTERDRALASGGGRLSRYLVDGWRFVTETGADTDPLWGTREQTAWSSGESLMIVGPPGVGKTTLAHQVVLARLGLQSTVLNMPVSPSERVLYLAMDRPKQIAHAMARRITPEHEAVLRDRLAVWQGPLPATLDKEPDLLADLAAAHQADTIVIDSLKDAVSTLVDDALAVAFHNARMRALRNGVEVMELHHQRKATADAPRGQRPTLDRVYGSTWITSGAGSVLFIAGEAGDPAVAIHHLKTPTGEIGPLQVIHDHERGTTTIEPTFDPVAILRAHPGGLTTRDLAAVLSGQANPDRSAVEKARRHLERLVKSGHARKTEGAAGGTGGGQQARYQVSNLHIAVG